jgi:hypothetical protein
VRRAFFGFITSRFKVGTQFWKKWNDTAGPAVVMFGFWAVRTLLKSATASLRKIEAVSVNIRIRTETMLNSQACFASPIVAN